MDIQVGHVYRAKKPANCCGFFNDRQVLYVTADVVQYDGPSVANGRAYPKVSRAKFEQFAGADVTANLPAGKWAAFAAPLRLLKSAMSITELAQIMRNIAADDKRELESYTDAEIVKEAEYSLSCFNEGGHQSNDELIGDHGPEAKREAKKQVAALKRLIAKAAA